MDLVTALAQSVLVGWVSYFAVKWPSPKPGGHRPAAKMQTGARSQAGGVACRVSTLGLQGRDLPIGSQPHEGWALSLCQGQDCQSWAPRCQLEEAMPGQGEVPGEATTVQSAWVKGKGSFWCHLSRPQWQGPFLPPAGKSKGREGRGAGQ